MPRSPILRRSFWQRKMFAGLMSAEKFCDQKTCKQMLILTGIASEETRLTSVNDVTGMERRQAPVG